MRLALAGLLILFVVAAGGATWVGFGEFFERKPQLAVLHLHGQAEGAPPVTVTGVVTIQEHWDTKPVKRLVTLQVPSAHRFRAVEASFDYRRPGQGAQRLIEVDWASGVPGGVTTADGAALLEGGNADPKAIAAFKRTSMTAFSISPPRIHWAYLIAGAALLLLGIGLFRLVPWLIRRRAAQEVG